MDARRSMRLRRKTFDWSTAMVATCMLVCAAVVYVRDGWDRFAAVFLGDVHIFIDILPKMAAGCLIGVFSTLLHSARGGGAAGRRRIGLRRPRHRDGRGRDHAGRAGHGLSGRRRVSRSPAPMSARRSPSSPAGRCSATPARWCGSCRSSAPTSCSGAWRSRRRFRIIVGLLGRLAAKTLAARGVKL